MLDLKITAVILAAYVVLFFSIHGYMDFHMFRRQSKSKSTSSEKSPFRIPFWAKITAFTPSMVFWVLFIASPVLLYTGVYSKVNVMVVHWKYEHVLQEIGLILLFIGVVLADWGRVSRGVTAPSLDMPEGYTLTTHGAYNVVRHPMYVSYSLFFVGFPLVVLTPVLFWFVMGIFGYYRIAKEEERVLLQRFGDQYKKYQERVGMFFPTLV
ncbi:MAG: isoprenylcysteine carboxylmethyltransferase family protein [Candidatus Methanofastidiosia archaeon]|jgi:protein-S-isoprenylcysteine O-methyltransferase Ste14